MHLEMSPDCGMARLGDLIKFKVHSFSRTEIQRALFRRKIASWWASSSNIYSLSNPERCKKQNVTRSPHRTSCLASQKIHSQSYQFKRIDWVAGWLA
jgi:hypothetical protein